MRLGTSDGEPRPEAGSGQRHPGSRPRLAFVSQPEYFRFTYEHDLDDLADTREFRTKVTFGPRDYQELLEFDADYNLFFRGELVPATVLRELRGHRIALSSEPFPRLIDGRWRYTRDSVRRYLAFRSIRDKAFDYLFHYDATSLPLLERDGLSPSGEFAFPVATSMYRPREQPQRWDLFFIGRSTDHRERYLGPLKHEHEFLHICHGVSGEPLVEFIGASAISLNVHAEAEISWEPRMQMLLACEAFVISETIAPNQYLRPGVDYISVNNPAEMSDAVGHYLRHEDERRAIAQAGRQRVLEVLDSRACFGALMASINEGKVPRFEPSAGWALLDGLSRARDLKMRARRAWP